MRSPARSLTAALLAALLLPPPLVAEDVLVAEQASREAYERGAAAYKEGREGEAIAAFREALALWAENESALNDLAWALLTAKDEALRAPAEALPLAQEAVRLAPRRAGFLDTLATALDATGSSGEAARLEARAARLEANPFFGEQLRRFAERALAEEALDPCARAELLRLAGEGTLLEGRGDGADARAHAAAALGRFDEALALGAASAHAGRGKALAALERWSEAESALALALGAEGAAAPPEEEAPVLWRLRGEALRHLGRHAEAGAALDEAASEAGPLELRLEAARCWRAAQRPERVAVAVAAALASIDEVPPLWPAQWRARFLRLEGEAFEGALEAFPATAPAAARAPLHAAALHALARSAAARAEDRALDERIFAHARATGLGAAARASDLELRWHLGAEVLGVEALPRFRDITAAALPPGCGGRRVAFADVDGDGDPDLLLGGRRLLQNDGGGAFADITAAAGLASLSACGGVFADFDRDGDLDLYLIGHGPGADRLLRNESGAGAVRFADVTGALGVGMCDDDPSEGAAWGDLNGDGYPDLYVANYEFPPDSARGTADRLYLSDGHGAFRDASALLAAGGLQCGRGVAMADFDGDGDTDIFVANYRLDPDFLWVNQGASKGEGGSAAGEWAGLAEEGAARGVAGVSIRGAYGHGIGAAWGDLDGDGRLDLVAAHLAHPRFIEFSDPTMLYLQGADGRFADQRGEAGVGFEETHSDPTLFDADDDGDLDLYLTSVYPGRPSFLWRNELRGAAGPASRPASRPTAAPLSFADVTWASGVRVFDGWGGAVADIDGDGDLDLCVCGRVGGRGDTGVRLFRNEGPAGRTPRSVRVRLRGTRSDTWGAGATATLEGAGAPQVRHLSLGHGTTSQSEPVLHFGVGAAEGPFRLTVRWPSGARSEASLVAGSWEVIEPAE